MAELKNGTEILSGFTIVDDKQKEGTYYNVIKARNEQWEKDIAVKLPMDEIMCDYPEAYIYNFRKWTELEGHPYITPCYYAGIVDGTPMILTEWCDGDSLSSLIESGALYNGNAEHQELFSISIAIQSLAGLYYLHRNNIVHGNIKPSNIRVNRNGIAKLTDIESNGFSSINYCAPERIEHHISDFRSDVYSWALTSLEMFIGKRTWDKGEEVSRNFDSITEKTRIPIPDYFKRILKKCLSLSPDERMTSRRLSYEFNSSQDYRKVFNKNGNLRFVKVMEKLSPDSAYYNNLAVMQALMNTNKERAFTLFNRSWYFDKDNPHRIFNMNYYKWFLGIIDTKTFLDETEKICAEDKEIAEKVHNITAFTNKCIFETADVFQPEGYKPDRFSKCSRYILFRDEAGLNWKVFCAENNSLIDVFQTTNICDYDEVSCIIDIKWAEGSLTDFTPVFRDGEEMHDISFPERSCISPDGKYLITMINNGTTALLCSNKPDALHRLYQNKMPSVPDIMDNYRKKTDFISIMANKMTGNKDTADAVSNAYAQLTPRLKKHGFIGNNVRLVKKHLPIRDYNFFTVYDYNLNQKFTAVSYNPKSEEDAKNHLSGFGEYMKLSAFPGISAPLRYYEYEKRVVALYDDAVPFLKNKSVDINLTNYVIGSAIQLLYTLKYLYNTCNKLVYGLSPDVIMQYGYLDDNLQIPLAKVLLIHMEDFWYSFKSPELKNGEENSISSVLYSLGVALFDTITQRSDTFYYESPKYKNESFVDTVRMTSEKLLKELPSLDARVIEFIEKLTETDPKDRFTLDEAISFLKTHYPELDKAVTDFYTDFDEKDNKANYLNNLAVSYAIDGNRELAEKTLDEALKIDDRNCVAVYNKLFMEYSEKNSRTDSDIFHKLKALKKRINEGTENEGKNDRHITLTKIITLGDLYDENGNLIRYRTSPKDKLYTTADGDNLLLYLNEHDLCIHLGNDEYNRKPYIYRIRKAYDSTMDTKEQTHGLEWLEQHLPAEADRSFAVRKNKSRIILGRQEPGKFIPMDSIEEVAGAYCFVKFYGDTAEDRIAVLKKNATIEIYSVPSYKESYILCSGTVNKLDKDFEKGEITIDMEDNQNILSDDELTDEEIYEETTLDELARQYGNEVYIPVFEEYTSITDTLKLISAQNKVMLEDMLKKVKGQDHVVHTVCDAIFDAQAFICREKDRRRPMLVFTFAGPPGVGKTFLAETLAENLKLPFARFDMTEYSGHHTHEGLIGFEAAWKGATPGKLTSFVKENPKCVLLFDEIEKAHANVIQLFYQLLDEGALTDKYFATKKDDNGEHADEKRGLVSFKDTIIIFTTNAGRSLYEGAFMENCAGVTKKTLLNALTTEKNPQTDEPFFPTAIVSRIATGYPVIFNNLKPYNLIQIINGNFQKTKKTLEETHYFQIEADNDVMLSLLFNNGGRTDARQISASVAPFIKSEIKKALTKTNRFDIVKFRFVANYKKSDNNQEISDIFRAGGNTSVLIYSSGIVFDYCTDMLGDGFTVYHAGSIDKACDLAEQYDIGIVLIDISHKDSDSLIYTNVAHNTIYSSMAADKWKDATRLFTVLREKMPELPIYLIEDSAEITDTLLSDFVTKGARGKINIAPSENEQSFPAVLTEIAEQLYMEKKAWELAARSNILTFDTVPRIENDTIVIELRNYELKFAVDADDASSVLSDMERPDITFKDVIGAEEAKEDLREFISYIKNPKSYTFNGKEVPKGILLYGNPGTGKTYLAKAMAGECKTTFIPVNASDLVSSSRGSGPAAIHELFQKARRYAPSIVFIDEVDSIGKDRAFASEITQNTLNALLTEMQGFNNNTKRPVFVIAATNYDTEYRFGSAGKLDGAFVRRFDRKIKIELPDKNERIQLINMLLGKLRKHNVTSEDIDNIADRTTGISPAIITNIFQNALKKVPDGEALSGKYLDEALETEMFGKKIKRSDEEILRTAQHECGHAIIYRLTGYTPAYLTVVARSNFNGYMRHSDEELNSTTANKQKLLNKIRTSLGGRAAEVVCYGDEEGLGAGASADLRYATAIAYDMITRYGMDKETGLAVWDDKTAFQSEAIRKRVNEILENELEEAKRLINLNRKKFDKLVYALVKENRLSADQIDKILGKTLKTK